MSVILIILPLSLVLAIIGVVVYAIAVRKGQFEDLETPAMRVVFDDDDDQPQHTDTDSPRD